MRFRARNTSLSPSVVDMSKMVPLLQFFFVRRVSYVAFVLSLFVPHLSFFWCLRKAVLRDCGIPWLSSNTFLKHS